MQPSPSFIYSVFKLNTLAKSVLEETIPRVWVEGELSNFMQPQSGHYYFSLKDENAQIRCVMFKGKQRGLHFIPKNGMQVLLYGQLTLYPDRGTFQLLVECMEETGYGALQRAFEALKKKLHVAGLFDPSHKKPLPKFPKRVGVVTSPTGAAIRDVLAVLHRRAPMIEVIIYPSSVQGEEAAGQLVRALAKANTRQECDVLLLVRGGGSLEDLWPFNEEAVAQAIFASKLPVVSGVGHEIDVTIADFVADQRAPTPSAAAECVAPDTQEIMAKLDEHQHRLLRVTTQHLRESETRLMHLKKRLRHPGDLLQQTSIQLKEKRHYLDKLLANQLTQTQDRLSALTKLLYTVNPYQVLARGYAIVTHASSGHPVTNSQTAAVGEPVNVQLHQGQLLCKVEKITAQKTTPS